MHSITLPTKRPNNEKVLLVLLGMIVPAAFLGIPFSATLREAGLGLLVVDALLNIAIVFLLCVIGLRLAGRIGLGVPFIEGAVCRAPIWHRFPRVMAVAMISGVVMVLVLVGLQQWVFGPLLAAEMKDMAVTPPHIQIPAWQRFLMSLRAGVLEEIVYRLFALTVLARLGSLVFHDAEGRPPLSVLWIANILVAVVFGLAHLPTATAFGLPMTQLVVTQTLVLQGLGGLILGWLYWSRGLESAMVAHASGNFTVVILSLISGAATR